MFKKAYAIGLLSFASLGFASLPAQAQNVVNTSGQTANQAVVINGDRNKVKLRIIQVNTTNGQYSNTDNLSTQRANQGVVIDGNGNRVDMRVRQVNAYNQSNRQFEHKKYGDDDNRNSRNYNNGRHNSHNYNNGRYHD
jgi:hypothetical protein